MRNQLRRRRTQLHGIGHDVVDSDGAWRATTGLHGGGAVLVRPDHHVAARSDEGLSPATVAALRLPYAAALPPHVRCRNGQTARGSLAYRAARSRPAAASSLAPGMRISNVLVTTV